MKPKWQKLASLAQKYAHSSFSYLMQSLLPNDTLLRTHCTLYWIPGKVIWKNESFRNRWNLHKLETADSVSLYTCISMFMRAIQLKMQQLPRPLAPA